MEQKKALIIFTRVPVPGQTKTRLMPYYSGDQCAKLHTCFLRDIQEVCTDVAADVFVYYTLSDEVRPPKAGVTVCSDECGILQKIFGSEASYCLQQGEGLGERMYLAFGEVLGRGYASCVLLGSDVPEINAEDIDAAFSLLEEKEVVFGPTEDGGYYLVGMKVPRTEVFDRQSYGHGNVLENTISVLDEAGISTGFIRMQSDIDVREDVQSYRERMRQNPMLQSTHTGKFLMRTSRISVIVPIYNEESTIIRMQEQLRGIQDKCEVLLVDGGSTDRTLELIEPEFRVLHSKKGRANQMNLGAKESSGDVLFFLHCDSELPDEPLEHIRYVMKDHRAGCFGIAFHSKNFFMFTCRVISNHRVKDRKVMFGDQGIFIDRELFFNIGMFPDMPIMEDYEFSLRLKKLGERLGMAGRRIYTSDRRFPKGTIPKLRVMWKMNRLRKMYRDGVSIDAIAQMYRDVR